MRCRTSTTTKPVTISIAGTGNRISIAYYMRNFQHAERTSSTVLYNTLLHMLVHFVILITLVVKLLVKHDCSWCSY